MPLQLRDDLHWCDCGGRVVFLDTWADRYFCLPQTANDAFLRTAAQRSRTGDEAQLQMLMKHGMLIENDARANIPPPPQIEVPTRDLFEEPALHASRTLILRALLAELGAAWALRQKSFHMVIEAARLPRSTRSRVPRTSTLQEIAAAAAAVAFITRSHDRCLVRALAVHSMCKEIAATTKLVFGVVAHPFTAHCWVQLGSAVIVGGYEQARLYTPILVIE
jgi:transglutaminase superfamily protein